MIISDLLNRKQPRAGDAVLTIAPTASVEALLSALAEHNVGALVVLGDDAAVLGIVSERDVVRQLAADGTAALGATVERLMTASVVSCSSSDDVEAIATTMTERRIRHMPVLDDGALTGLVSIGDVVAGRIAQLERDRVQLEQYITS